MFAQCPNDLTAILVARDALRKGETVEVWRDDRLVYRIGLRQEPVTQKTQRPKAKRPSLKIVGQLARFRIGF